MLLKSLIGWNVFKTEDVGNSVKTPNTLEALEEDVEDLVDYENTEEALRDGMNENNVQPVDVEETLNNNAKIQLGMGREHLTTE